MKHLGISEKSLGRGLLKLIAGSRLRLALFGLAVLMASALVTAAVGAYNRSALRASGTVNPVTADPVAQGAGRPRGDLHLRLALQPEADKFRRRIGKRFVESGKEESTLTGSLTIGAEHYQVRIVRTQDDDDEDINISLNGGGALTWNGRGGAKSGGLNATGLERSVIERIALDSPDQFVLAQTRGASYYPVARMVEPVDAGENYYGPVWDLIRIVEPQRGSFAKPQDEWRIYFINCTTGLIDKIRYQDQGDNITVEMLGWANRGGEMEPSLIRWSRDGKIEMQLSFSNISHGARQ